jgi:ring-1,2-phenylacetyl-CoA epoxidase subunit PaaE
VQDLAAGAELEVMTPSGTFTFDPDPLRARHVVCLAVGSGITPVLSIVATVLAGEPASRVTLLYGNRTTADVMFAEDLEDLKNRHPARLQILHVLSREPQESPLRAGRLDAAKLETVLGGLVPAGDVADWYLCGPQELVAQWRATLLAAGVPKARVHRELFHAGPPLVGAGSRAGERPAGPARRVTFTLDGRSSTVDVGPGEAVLDGVLRLRADAPYACRGGVCGTCRAQLVSGDVEMAENYALEADELGAGYVLTCQARPVSDTVVLDYDT